MTTCRQLSNELCRGACGTNTLHDHGGCVHRRTCGGVRPPVAVRIERTDYDEHHAKARPQPKTGVESLTFREKAILREIGVGGSCGAVARRLNMSAASVRSHRSRICQKLGITFVVGGPDVLCEFARTLGLHRLET